MYQKKSKEQWDSEALAREGEALISYTNQYGHVTGNAQGQAMLLAHEIRQLRQELKWVANYLKRLANAAPVQVDDKVPF